MRISKQSTAAALAAAITLASGAYALGSQAGDGAAVAAGGDEAQAAPARWGGGPPGLAVRGGPPGAAGLADRLGVDEDKLEDALRDLRGTMRPPGPPGDDDGDFAEELAGELGTTQAKVEAALERIRARHEDELEAQRDELAQKPADRLNLDASEVEDALGDSGPPGHHLHRRP